MKKEAAQKRAADDSSPSSPSMKPKKKRKRSNFDFDAFAASLTPTKEDSYVPPKLPEVELAEGEPAPLKASVEIKEDPFSTSTTRPLTFSTRIISFRMLRNKLAEVIKSNPEVFKSLADNDSVTSKFQSFQIHKSSKINGENVNRDERSVESFKTFNNFTHSSTKRSFKIQDKLAELTIRAGGQIELDIYEAAAEDIKSDKPSSYSATIRSIVAALRIKETGIVLAQRILDESISAADILEDPLILKHPDGSKPTADVRNFHTKRKNRVQKSVRSTFFMFFSSNLF